MSKVTFRHLVEKAVVEISLALVKKFKVSEKEALREVYNSNFYRKLLNPSGEGSHVLKWVYQNNGNSVVENENCAWLDEVTWTPADPLPAPDGAPPSFFLRVRVKERNI